MPTYEYECMSCSYEFEAFQRITEEPLHSCPKCGRSVRRLFSGGTGVIFKGSGFYTTDNKKTGAVSGNGSSKSKEPITESQSDKKSQESRAGDTRAEGSKPKLKS